MEYADVFFSGGTQSCGRLTSATRASGFECIQKHCRKHVKYIYLEDLYNIQDNNNIYLKIDEYLLDVPRYPSLVAMTFTGKSFLIKTSRSNYSRKCQHGEGVPTVLSCAVQFCHVVTLKNKILTGL